MRKGFALAGRLRRIGAMRGFNPAATLFAANEPGVWYDPSDLTTLFQDTAGTTPVTTPGQSVARINDKSGRGNHATQATAASRPTYQIDANGKPYLAFDGVDDFLVTPTITPGIDKAQVFAGVRKVSGVGFQALAEYGTGIAENGFSVFAPSSANNDYDFRLATNPRATGTTYPPPITNVLAVSHDISGATSALETQARINGASVSLTGAAVTSGNFINAPLYIGRRGGTTLPFNGRIYSLIVRFGANLTNAQITNTETWVNGKTGAY